MLGGSSIHESQIYVDFLLSMNTHRGLETLKWQLTGMVRTKSLRLACRRASQIARSEGARPKGSRLLRTVPEKITGSCTPSNVCISALDDQGFVLMIGIFALERED